MSYADLTLKQQRFVDEYMVDFNATRAAKAAGYSENTAHVIGSENLEKPKIQAALKERTDALQQRTEVTLDRVVEELAKLAFMDPRNLFDESGKPVGISQLDDATAAAIAGVDVAVVGNQDMGLGEILKVRLSDKHKALDSLMKHLGGYKEGAALQVFNNPTTVTIKAKVPEQEAGE